MKKFMTRMAGTLIVSVLLTAFNAGTAKAQDATVSYQEFYDELSPYGQWVEDPQYGNVWVPNEDADFRPYYNNGHWVMTEYGNTWISDDPWGWAAYHYGRWTYNGYYGWVWIPGYEWAPAWVSWRYGGGYCGWAPMGPGFEVGIAVGCPDDWWVFVGPQYLYNPGYHNYWRGPEYNHHYLTHTSLINNVYEDNHTHVHYNYGPRASAIGEATHHPVTVYHFASSNRPGGGQVGGNTVSIYRPNVDHNSIRQAHPANVMQAPHNIGRPQQTTNQAGHAQPTFRNEHPEIRNTPPPVRHDNYNQPRNNPQPVQQQPRNVQPQQQPRNVQPQQQQPRNNPQQQPRNNPQQQQQPRNNPQPQQQPRNYPQQQQQQPRNYPQPQQQQPRNNPQPQQQQPRNNPQPQPRSNPQPQPRNNQGTQGHR